MAPLTPIVAVALALAALPLAAAPAAAAGEKSWSDSCQAFMARLQKDVHDLDPQFVRPVVVSRGGGGAGEARDLITRLPIDGQLTCDGDRFIRFEAKIRASAPAPVRDGFYRIQESAVAVKFGWPAGRAGQTLHAMTAEAADYLRASGERGDVYIAGKVERHLGEAGDIAFVWTRTDRTFILVAYVP